MPGDPLPIDVQRLRTNSHAQQYVAHADSPHGERQIAIFGSANGWADLPPYVEIGGTQYNQSPNYSLIEMAATPWDALDWRGPELSTPSRLVANQIIGFSIAVYDYDGDRQTGYAESLLDRLFEVTRGDQDVHSGSAPSLRAATYCSYA